MSAPTHTAVRVLPALVGLLVLFASGIAVAAEPLWRWVGVEDGLEASHVNDLDQAPDGPLWVATQAGVWRWDGERATRMDGGRIEQLVQRVVVDDRGDTWARTEFGDLWLVGTGHAEPVLDETGEAVVASDLDRGIDAPIASVGADLWSVGEDRRWHRWREGVVPPRTRLVRMHPDGRVIFGTSGGLWFLEPGETEAEQWAPSHNPWDLAIAEDGSVWTGDGLGRIVHFSASGEELWRMRAESRVLGVARRSGVTWVSCVRELVRISPDYTVERWGIEEGVTSGGRLLVGREGDLWMATFRGMGQLPEPDARLWDRRHGLPGESIRWVERWDNRVVLHGWWGLAWLEEAAPAGRGTDGRPRVGRLETPGLVKTRACRDSAGIIWGHFQGNDPERGLPEPVYLARAEDGRVTTYPTPSTHHALETCAPSATGHVWLSDGDSLYRTVPEGPPQRVSRWPAAPDVRSYRSLHEDASGRLWAVNSSTLCYALAAALTESTDPWTCTTAPGRSYVADVQDIEGGRIWAATTDVGVAEFDPATGQWRALPGLAELPGHHLNTISPSPRGGYWVAGYAGVLRVRPDAEQGWVAEESLAPWLGSLLSGANDVHEDADGTLWVAGMIGVAEVPPGSRTPPTAPPEVLLSELRVDGLPVSEGRFEQLVQADEAHLKAVQLPLSDSTLDVGFSSYVFRAPRLLRYRVQVDRGPWSEPMTEARLRLQALAPGRHVIRAAASLDGERWTERPAVVAVWVPRPWWGRWELWLLALTLLGLVALAVQRVHFAQRVRLEQLRTRIALDLHDDVGAGLGSIRLLAGLDARGLPEPARAEVTERISRTAAELEQALRGIVWSLRPGSQRTQALGQHLAERARRVLPDLHAAGALHIEVPETEADEPLDLEVLRAVRMVGSEALHNVARHAQATSAAFVLRPADAGCWELLVEDDGVGIDASDDAAATDDGVGLPGMRKRAREIGATLQLGSSGRFAGGTCVRLRFDPRRVRSSRRP